MAVMFLNITGCMGETEGTFFSFQFCNVKLYYSVHCSPDGRVNGIRFTQKSIVMLKKKVPSKCLPICQSIPVTQGQINFRILIFFF